jgi:hypothetical protein
LRRRRNPLGFLRPDAEMENQVVTHVERSSDLEEEKKFEEFFGILLFFEVLINLSDSKNFFDFRSGHSRGPVGPSSQSRDRKPSWRNNSTIHI